MMKLDLRKFGECRTSEEQRLLLLESTAKGVAATTINRNRVLVATYVQKMVTKGGIILSDRTLDESRFQGKVGVIIKVGPKAFHFPEHEHQWASGDLSFLSEYPKVGDWVIYKASDTWEVGIGGASCRFVYDDNIAGSIVDPEAIW